MLTPAPTRSPTPAPTPAPANKVMILPQRSYKSIHDRLKYSGCAAWQCIGCTSCGLRTMQTGTFSNGPSDYPGNANCEWMIAPANAHAVSILISSSSYSLGYGDYIYFYECSDAICSQSQLMCHMDASNGAVYPLCSLTTGFAKVVFISDSSGGSGFDATWNSVCSIMSFLFSFLHQNGIS